MKQRAFYIWMVPGSAVLIAAFALVLASKTRRPIPAEATSNHIDQLFSRWDRRDSPGAAVAVVMEGTIVYMRGYGMADLQHSVSITPAIPFDIASLSKQFTAMSIAMLAERGRLALDDDIRSYLPEIPDFGRPITIRHLVHHTSGLRDWVEALEIAGWRPGDPISTTEILRIVERQRELNFEPGTQHLYSNTGYTLLATIVERVTGESFDKWLESEIFQPLAMTSTRLPGGPDDPIRRSVRSYEGDGVGGFQYRPANIIAPGASSVHSTVEDLTKWILNFESCRVGGIAVMERMRETGVRNNGERIGYGFGHSIGVYRGVGFVGHGGQWGGFRSGLVRFPDHRFAVVVLSNVRDLDAERMCFDIAELYLGNFMSDGFRPLAWVRAALNRLVRWATVLREHDQPSAPVYPPNPSRVEELAGFVGDYHNEELDTTYTLVINKGTLVARCRRNDPIVLTQIDVDVYEGNVSFARRLHFHRNHEGKVIGFTLSGERVWNLRFQKCLS